MKFLLKFYWFWSSSRSITFESRLYLSRLSWSSCFLFLKYVTKWSSSLYLSLITLSTSSYLILYCSMVLCMLSIWLLNCCNSPFLPNRIFSYFAHCLSKSNKLLLSSLYLLSSSVYFYSGFKESIWIWIDEEY